MQLEVVEVDESTTVADALALLGGTTTGVVAVRSEEGAVPAWCVASVARFRELVAGATSRAVGDALPRLPTVPTHPVADVPHDGPALLLDGDRVVAWVPDVGEQWDAPSAPDGGRTGGRDEGVGPVTGAGAPGPQPPTSPAPLGGRGIPRNAPSSPRSRQDG